ncbi:ANTAR domain-containing protein [Haloechinothrix alba]|uniref:ANTAR domain-containing protein n=1 Tax=Haloechinothrix alba TaxID=664784 RepID=A0A238ZDL4_9PSEU|nr:GAF and ANTAR domain-containing protein [Haloechinothrix alba]SNR81189.1 ANTAR domain-containing protein [Haloechinothrix alba]
MTTTPNPGGVEAALANMARDLLAQDTVPETLERIVAHAVDLVDGCEGASILVTATTGARTLAATDDNARASDRVQGELGEGPCFDAARHGREVYRITDMTATVDRWPSYAPKARDLGIGSALGFLLFTEAENLGALNLYSGKPGAFDDRSEQIGWLLASHAAVAFANARTDAQLHEALATRTDIGEALGIIMERYVLAEHDAFAVLTKASQDHNIKVRDLARTITETGEVPGARGDRRGR